MPVSATAATSPKPFRLGEALKKFWKGYEKARAEEANKKIYLLTGYDVTKR